MSEFNPYAAPQSNTVVQYPSTEQERLLYINHEAYIRFIGGFWGLLGLLLMIVNLIFLGNGSGLSGDSTIPIFFGLIGLLTLRLGLGIRKFNPWCRRIVILFSPLGVLAGCLSLPGGIIDCITNGFVLWVLLSEKGRRIFKPDYKDVISGAPHVKAPTAIFVKLVLGLIFLIFARAALSTVNS